MKFLLTSGGLRNPTLIKALTKLTGKPISSIKLAFIPKLLKSRVYVGVSAGSYVATPDLRFNSDNVKEVLWGLHFVDFGLQVHLNSPLRSGGRWLRYIRKEAQEQ